MEIAYQVSEFDAFTPDVSLIRRDRLLRKGERILTGAPEIAVEVVSPTDTMVNVKAKIRTYLANGSRAVWVAYPDERLIEVHTSEGMREVKGDEAIGDPLLPGFSEPVSKFFERV